MPQCPYKYQPWYSVTFILKKKEEKNKKKKNLQNVFKLQ